MRNFRDRIKRHMINLDPNIRQGIHRSTPEDIPTGPDLGYALERLADGDPAHVQFLRSMHTTEVDAEALQVLQRIGRGEWSLGQGPEALDALADEGRLYRNAAGWHLAKHTKTRRLIRLYAEARRREFPLSDLLQTLPL